MKSSRIPKPVAYGILILAGIWLSIWAVRQFGGAGDPAQSVYEQIKAPPGAIDMGPISEEHDMNRKISQPDR